MAKAKVKKAEAVVIDDDDERHVIVASRASAPTDDIKLRTQQMVRRAQTLPITNDVEYAAAIEYWKRLKRMLDAWAQLHDNAIRKAKEALDAAKEVRDLIAKPGTVALDALKERAGAWMDARRAEQRTALAAQAQHRQVTVAAEASQRQSAQFDAAVSRGDTAKAAALLTRAVPTVPTIPAPAPPVVPMLPKLDGVSVTEPWTYDIIDETLIPREYCCPDRKLIAKVVKAMGPKTNIPGVSARPETGLRISTKD